MTTDDFKQKIALIMREKETGKKWSVAGGPRADQCVLRKTTKPRKQTNK